MKPELWQNEKVGGTSFPARLLYIGLITMADDQGRLRLLAPAILGHVFPYDELPAKKLHGWLDELETVSLIIRYEAIGKHFIWIVGWAKHQKINRPTDSELPPPPAHDSITERSVNGAGVLS